MSFCPEGELFFDLSNWQNKREIALPFIKNGQTSQSASFMISLSIKLSCTNSWRVYVGPT